MALFFSNSNIDTETEFTRRLENARILGRADGVEVVADAYDHENWLEHVAKGFENEPEKGARCARCFRYSLARTAAYAAAHGFDAFTTSLTVSPHKASKMVFEAGEDAATECAALVGRVVLNVPETKGPSSCTTTQNERTPIFLKVDFKKKDGFLRSIRRSAELGLYRQPYCGCEFSRH